MQIINNKLIAEDGMTLTNGEAFGKTVWLASGASPGDWWEVTDEEAKNRSTELTDSEALDIIMGVQNDETE